MPEPIGPGYQAPPSIGPVSGEERLRSIEDFLSRRIKARRFKNMTFTTPSNSFEIIPWEVNQYDTSGLYQSSSNKFVVPEGGEGDYLVIAQVRVINDSGASIQHILEVVYRLPTDAASTTRLIGAADNTSANQNLYLSVTGEITLRPGYEVFARFDGAASTSKIQGAADSFMSLSRLV